MVTDATLQKRQELRAFVERVLQPEQSVKAVIGIGSIASGLARPDSDIDAIVFLDPIDLFIVPAEFKWSPSDGSFHSIFENELEQDCLEFDFARLDLKQWKDPIFEWPEGRCSEMEQGWMAFDRSGLVAELITQRTEYSNEIRIAKLDEAITWLDQHLSGDGPQSRWESLGSIIANDRLLAAYNYLAQAIFAYNFRWRPWRNREMAALLALSWIPESFEDQMLIFFDTPSNTYDRYLTRVNALRSLFQSIIERLVSDGEYGDDAIGEAFIRSHEEPGRAWNMNEWNMKHSERKK